MIIYLSLAIINITVNNLCFAEIIIKIIIKNLKNVDLKFGTGTLFN